MKKMYSFSLMLCLLMVSMVVNGQNLKKLDDKYGFRDAIFETPITAFNDMVEMSDSSTIGMGRAYSRTSDDLKIGNAELESITYIFYDGKLSTILIKTKGYSNTKAMYETFAQQYGRGYQSNRYIEEYTWWGKRASMNIKQNSATSDGTLLMWSKPMYEKQRKENAEAAKKAAADL
jgi:hypothetical protein